MDATSVKRFNERLISPLKERKERATRYPLRQFNQRAISVDPFIKSICCKIDDGKDKTADHFTKLRLLNKFYSNIYNTEQQAKCMRIFSPASNATNNKTAPIFNILKLLPKHTPKFIQKTSKHTKLKQNTSAKPTAIFHTRHSSLSKIIDLYKMRFKTAEKKDDLQPNIAMQPLLIKQTNLRESMTVNRLVMGSLQATTQRISFSQQTNTPTSLFDENKVNINNGYLPISMVKRAIKERQEEHQQLSGWDIDDDMLRNTKPIEQ